MRYLAIFLVCFLPLFAAAQITITRNDMPEPGDTLRYSNADPMGVNTTATGANHVWDYSNLVPRSQDRIDYVYSLQTVYAFYFLGINQYGTKIADTIGGGPFQFTNVYNFFRSANADFRAEGIGFEYSGVPLAAYYSDEDELYEFPLDYLDQDTNFFRFSVDLGNGLRFSEEGTRYNSVDGWGTVITPYDNIACLRLVSVTEAIDTIVFNGFPFATPNEQKTIKFLANGVHIPILEISGRMQQGQWMPQQVKYRDQYRNLVAVDPTQSSAIKMYPNPAQDLVMIDNLEQLPLTLEWLDAQGHTISQETHSESKISTSVANLANGVYLLRVRDAEGSILRTQKIVVAK
jgi:hypothetical protein